METTTSSELYPVYIVLFASNNKFSKVIYKVTNQRYSHAVISLDPSLNNMYSFRPMNINRFTGNGFIRESIWAPIYSDVKFFSVLVTFVNKDDWDAMNKKIESFKRNYTSQSYNSIGLIKYYLNFKETKNIDETKKNRWFCSEFVAYMLKTGNISGFENIMRSPGDLAKSPNALSLGDFTLNTFKESDLKRRTEIAKKEFISRPVLDIQESFSYMNYNIDIVSESIFNKSDNKDERVVEKYTAMLDWKLLYDKFIEIFKYTKPEIRFSLFEIIVKKYFIPFKITYDNATEKIINEMINIRSYIKARVISFIDNNTGEIYIYINGKVNKLKYPEFFHDNKLK